MQNEEISVLVTVDKAYVQYAGIMLCSLFENNKLTKFTIYIAIDFEEDIDIVRLRKLVNQYQNTLIIIKLDSTIFQNYPINRHVSQAVYYRLLAPELLNKDLKKILYLDADIIIKTNITALWETNITDYILAAVEEQSFDRHQIIDFPINYKYFNSGVILINLEKWRTNLITKKLFDFIKEYPEKIDFWDQDALNHILLNQWLILPTKWNQTREIVEQNLSSEKYIIHYTGSIKPWNSHCNHPFKSEYYYYMKLSPWQKYKPIEETVWYRWKQILKKISNIIKL